MPKDGPEPGMNSNLLSTFPGLLLGMLRLLCFSDLIVDV